MTRRSIKRDVDPFFLAVPDGSSLQSLSITPDLPSVAPGSIIQMTAIGHYSDGSIVNLTSAVAWASDNGAVATITSGSMGGVLTAGGAGSCNISATLGAVSASIPMTIPASSLWRTGWVIPTATGSTPEAGGRVYSMPLFIPPDVTTLNVRLANRVADGTAQVNITVNVAVYKSDGTGLPTGAAFAVFNGQVVPGNNTVLSVGPFPGVVRGTDGKVVLVIGMAQGAAPTIQINTSIVSFISGTNTVSPAPGGLVQTIIGVMVAHLEFNSAARHIIAIGDSITGGFDGTDVLLFPQTAFQIIASDRVYAMDIEAAVGFGSIQHFSQFATNTNLWDEAQWNGADVIIDLGTNDLSYANLATMKTVLNTLIAHLQTLGVNKIYASTIPPQANYPGTDAIRAAYNAYLLANFGMLGITAVYDRAAAKNAGGLADNVNPNILFAGFDVGDGTHINAAGNQQVKTGWEAIL
jgi:hypothetical protein